MVNTGRTSSNGVDSEAFFEVISPISKIWEIIIADIIRLCTSGQNAAPLSYCWW